MIVPSRSAHGHEINTKIAHKRSKQTNTYLPEKQTNNYKELDDLQISSAVL